MRAVLLDRCLYVDVPDHYTQAPIALGGAHYALGSCRFVLSTEIVRQGQLMDERFQPLDQTVDVELWEKTHSPMYSSAWNDGLTYSSPDGKMLVGDDMADEVLLDGCSTQPQEPVEKNGQSSTRGKDANPRCLRHRLQRMKSWASISSDSGASVIPIEICDMVSSHASNSTSPIHPHTSLHHSSCGTVHVHGNADMRPSS